MADKLNMIRAKTPSALNLMGCEELELGMTHLGVEGAHLLASAMSSHGAQVLQRITHVNLTWTAIGVAAPVIDRCAIFEHPWVVCDDACAAAHHTVAPESLWP